MQTMRQALNNALPVAATLTLAKFIIGFFKQPREWTWLSTIPVRNPAAGVDYSGNSQFNLIADILREACLHQCGSRQLRWKKNSGS